MHEPMLARHPLWFKISAYGVLLYLITLILFFIGSLFFSGLDSTTPDEQARSYTLALAVVSPVLGFIAYLIARFICWPRSERSALGLGLGWAGIQLTFNFLVSLVNGNTQMIFSSPSTYLVYIAVIVGALAFRLHRTS